MNNFWTDNNIFDKYVKACGSRFAAIMYVSKIARRRRSYVDYCITESQALAWVITGVEPEEIQSWKSYKFNKVDKGLQYAEDRLAYIEDKEVHDAVHHTIHESRTSGHLIYRYKGISSKCKKARVRILSNIIWDEIQKIDLADKL